jgi:hypothetical protein
MNANDPSTLLLAAIFILAGLGIVAVGENWKVRLAGIACFLFGISMIFTFLVTPP